MIFCALPCSKWMGSNEFWVVAFLTCYYTVYGDWMWRNDLKTLITVLFCALARLQGNFPESVCTFERIFFLCLFSDEALVTHPTEQPRSEVTVVQLISRTYYSIASNHPSHLSACPCWKDWLVTTAATSRASRLAVNSFTLLETLHIVTFGAKWTSDRVFSAGTASLWQCNRLPVSDSLSCVNNFWSYIAHYLATESST